MHLGRSRVWTSFADLILGMARAEPWLQTEAGHRLYCKVLVLLGALQSETRRTLFGDSLQVLTIQGLRFSMLSLASQVL